MRITSWRGTALASAVLLAAALTGSSIPASATTYANATSLQLWVPMYSPAMWSAYDFLNGSRPNVAIANWGSNTQNSGAGGPGTAEVSADATLISNAISWGSTIYGYIATNYGTGAAGYTDASVETQMTDWHTWYGVTRFFLDQVPTATTYQSFYSTLASWMKANISSKASLALNMGAYPANAAIASWVAIAAPNGGAIMDWENSTAPTTPPSDVDNYPASDFIMDINGLQAGDSGQEDCQLPSAVEAIEQAHAGGGFITSDPTYQTLPDITDFDLMAEIAHATVTSWDIPTPFACTYGSS
jgi:hypothetical protein